MDTCDQWTHIKCTGYISEAKYKILSTQDGDFTFYCRKCTFDFLPDSNFLCEINPERLDISQKLPSEANGEQFQCFLQKGLHFLHLNARSLLPKISELKIIAEKSRAAVISVTETWLDSSVTDQEIAIENYCVIPKDRNRNGGGVCTYIRSEIAFSSLYIYTQ